MNQHTPGPWTAHDDDGTGTLPCVLSDKVNPGGNWYVAQCNLYEDARLIAAALEMLEWLTKSRQMARQQRDGGENAPMVSAWGWLDINLTALLTKIDGKE